MPEISAEVFIPWLGPTLNQVWAGIHWSKRQKIAHQAHKACLAAKHAGPFAPPIRLSFKPTHGKGRRRLDCTNYAVSIKAIEDGLVQAGVIPGDSFSEVVGIDIEAPQRGAQSGMTVRITGEQPTEGEHE